MIAPEGNLKLSITNSFLWRLADSFFPRNSGLWWIVAKFKSWSPWNLRSETLDEQAHANMHSSDLMKWNTKFWLKLRKGTRWLFSAEFRSNVTTQVPLDDLLERFGSNHSQNLLQVMNLFNLDMSRTILSFVVPFLGTEITSTEGSSQSWFKRINVVLMWSGNWLVTFLNLGLTGPNHQVFPCVLEPLQALTNGHFIA